MKSYLVQRATSYDTLNRTACEDRKGIDTLVSWDYMGSAEFEFGALFQSMQRVRKDIDQYELFSYEKTANGYPVYVFCKKDKKEEVFTELNRLKAERYCGLKECIHFNHWFDPRINVPSRKDLRVLRRNGNVKILVHRDEKNKLWKETYEEDNGKITWSDARFIENFWFDLENDFMFFVDKSSCLKGKFLETMGVKY